MSESDDSSGTQDTRHMALDTVAGTDKLLPLKMEGTETLGRLFEYELHVFSEGGDAIKAKDLLGTNATVRLKMGDDTRYFNGYITRFVMESVNKNRTKVLYTYRLTLTPALWRLTRTATCRIFQQKTVCDIVKQIMQDASVEVDDSNVTGSYRTWDYCVQYRETDFNFISRLLENEGIYYYYKHENGKHTVMLCDSPTAHNTVSGYEKLQFKEPDIGTDVETYVWNWEHESQQLSNTYELMDYNPETPSSDLFSTASAVNTESTSILGLYDYPGAYAVAGDGQNYAKVRMQEVEAQYQIAEAETSARGIFAGSTFTLEDYPCVDCVSYLVTSTTITLTNDDFGTNLGDADSEEGFYSEITVMPANVQYRSPRLTPKPLIQGPQTAVIEGAAGDEICTDDMGRAKVHFYWDKATGQADKSSCWIRISQNWAGKRWGAIFLPRVGQEVIVEFLEGDPDRPIITGRVYHKENLPPYDLPGNKTMSAIKSNSSVGGSGFNEFRFEDKKGEEQIFIHAEKNMDIRVKNDRFETVGVKGVGNRHLTVEQNAFYHIKNNQNWTVDNNYNEKIGQDFNLQIGGKEAKKVTGTQSLEVTGDVAEVFHGKHSETTDGNYTLKADNIILEGKTSVTVKVGGDSVYIEAGKIHINGSSNVIIDGASQTKITGSSKASSIQIDSGITETASASYSLSAADASITGSSGVTVTGATIKLN